GLVNDIFGVKEDEELTGMRERFKEDPWALEIIEYLAGATTSLTVRERRRLHHRATGFWIEKGRLWRGNTKTKDRTSKAECIPCVEGLSRARKTHEENGHFAWDHARLHLQDEFFWPTLYTMREQPL
ncbi:hypothetical protein M422DRAFT_170516, partial [Sphaerobolus stellatus SS14]